MYFIFRQQLKSGFGLTLGADIRLWLQELSTDHKVTIVKDAANILKIGKGDIIAFYQEDGKIYVEKE